MELRSIKENYLINIKSLREIDDDEDLIEISTTGDFKKVGDKCYIIYKEYDSTEPRKYRMCVVKIEAPNRVEMIKNESIKTKIILEKDKRHYCPYNVENEALMVSVYTKCINFDFNEKCGKLTLEYAIDINSISLGTKKVVINFIKIDNKEKLCTI